MKWQDPFQDVLNPATPPPELGREERRRYYIAYGWCMLLIMCGFVGGFLAGSFAVFGFFGGLEGIVKGVLDPSYSRQYGHIWLPVSLTTAVLGAFVANNLWHLLFVKSGYLSHAATQRLMGNRAPTERGERIRVAVGYVTYLLILFGSGIFMVIYGEGTPLHIFSAIGLNGMGVFIAVHAFLRYRKKAR
ncbi:MAG: hypothetical protein IDH49_14605 [Gammaproteobacteria bacterium]|nr:hypothetical protein [Gammaproteobacteria bacterium]